MTFLDLKIWDENAGVVYKEIVNRFGMEDYQNETTRETHIATLKAEWDLKQYARERVTEYPNIGDQLDDLFKAGAFSTEMTAAIQAVKDKYPKS